MKRPPGFKLPHRKPSRTIDAESITGPIMGVGVSEEEEGIEAFALRTIGDLPPSSWYPV